MNIWVTVQKGSVEDIKASVTAENVNSLNMKGNTPISYAVHRNIDVLKLLIEKGANINTVFSDGCTCIGQLHFADSGLVEKLQFLLSLEINLTYADRQALARLAHESVRTYMCMETDKIELAEQLLCLLIPQGMCQIKYLDIIIAHPEVFKSSELQTIAKAELDSPQKLHGDELETYKHWITSMGTLPIEDSFGRCGLKLFVPNPHKHIDLEDSTNSHLYLAVSVTSEYDKKHEPFKKVLVKLERPTKYTSGMETALISAIQTAISK